MLTRRAHGGVPAGHEVPSVVGAYGRLAPVTHTRTLDAGPGDVAVFPGPRQPTA
ncbi:hypothetical protein [Streptomyces sp. NPDC048157]|uniref:hypothetical protein n=1 Tax=Streptomyces sp. NPDC048157 TaxID=3365503 RepID=UPI0037142BC1